jgi:hypothetical protein
MISCRSDSEDSETEGGLGNVTRVVMRPPGQSGKAKRGHLCFDASFETGKPECFRNKWSGLCCVGDVCHSIGFPDALTAVSSLFVKFQDWENCLSCCHSSEYRHNGNFRVSLFNLERNTLILLKYQFLNSVILSYKCGKH